MLLLPHPHQLHPSPVQSAALGSCSTVAAGGSGQGSGVQCSAHHLKVPAPEVQSFWSFIYYNPLFFFLFFLSLSHFVKKNKVFLGVFRFCFFGFSFFLLSMWGTLWFMSRFLLDPSKETHSKDHGKQLDSQHSDGKSSCQVHVRLKGVQDHRVAALPVLKPLNAF